MQAGERALEGAGASLPRALPTAALLRDPTPPNRAEIVWRVGLILAAANMLLLGIGIAASNPRHASNWNLLFALLAFFAYYNLINLSQAWVGSGRISVGVALGVGHGGILVLALALLWWRDNGMRRVAVRRGAGAVGGRARRRARRMRTVRRLFHADITASVAFVSLAFLALFFFIDFVDELRSRRRARLHRGAGRRLRVPARAFAPVRADADHGPDRHHLHAGPPGPDLAVHDPAHRRPRPRRARSGC